VTSEAVSTPLYRDPERPVDARAADLLARMTLAEKVAQLGSAWVFQLAQGETLDVERAAPLLADGLGQVTRVSGGSTLGAVGAARLANDIQRHLVEGTRLGVPAIIHEEALHGLMASGAVVHPQSIGLAATFQPELVERMASFIGRSMRARGAHLVLAPIFDVTRDPRWGRLEETYGEDTYLVTAMALAYVRGAQGEGVLACGKHLVGHGMPEGGMNRAPAHIGPRELRETFLLPFEAAVRTERLATVMHAYDDVDGIPCVASHQLLTDILRDEWGFDGLVVSDYDGVSEIVLAHGMTNDRAVAAAMALDAGLDQELPQTVCFGEPLAEAVERGLVDEATVDRAVERILRTKLRLGIFESPYVNAEAAAPDTGEERELALESAVRSIVLLQNDGILPLRDDLRRIAVIGPNADDARNLLGDYAHALHIQTLLEMRDRGNVFGFPIPDWLADAGPGAGVTSVLHALRERLPSPEVRYARGSGLLDGDEAGIAEAVAAARGADLALLVLGERSGLTDDAVSGEARDRLDIGLPGRQQQLLDAVAATGVAVVLVLVAGRPLAIPQAAETCAAILHAWVPGERGAEAIVDVLTGAAEPGGRLPVTVPRHVGQVPIFHSHRPSGGRSAWKGAYVDGSNLPLWPFGHGLGYTTIELSDLTLSSPSIPADGSLEVGVTAVNTGARAGSEVVQLYIRDIEASRTRPVKELRGFARVDLEPGESRSVTFTLHAEQLAFVEEPGRWLVEPGLFTLMVGRSSADLPLQAELRVEGPPVRLLARSRFLTGVAIR
jgi:beta-glucosidase